MPLKKSELYSSLWKSCDELRGGMDASQYKDYVLVLLFMKYVSDRFASDPDSLIEVPKGGSFADMVGIKNDKEIGDRINKIIGLLADANENLKGAITVADWNDDDRLGKGKEMVDRLTKLVAIFEGLDFGQNRAEGDDLLGDAYEYLMRHFATESGKSKGQFYTPAEVSRVMSRVIGLGEARAGMSIYDPTCGSGSLLLKAHDEAQSKTGLDLALYGQEMDNATSALARMNMVLHGCPTAEIWQDNTLTKPHWKDESDATRLKTFDFLVANPPFSNKNWTSGLDPDSDLYHRFDLGIPPEKNGDYAFLLHMLASLKSTGKAAVILPHGVLFPPSLVISRYFPKEKAGLEALEAERDALTRRIEEAEEEQGGEEGILAEARNDKGKITAKSLKDRIKEIARDKTAAEELKALKTHLALIDEESQAGKKLKEAEQNLEALVLLRYAKLGIAEVQSLVIESKWLPHIESRIQGEVDRVSQTLTGRLRLLAERYATPLPTLIEEVETPSAKVSEHLRKMGAKL